MIDEVRTLMDQYSAWLRDKTTIRQLESGWVEVTTPYLDRHSDHLQVYIQRSGDSLVLTDDSYTIRDLELSGCDLSSPRRQDLLRTVVNGFGVQLDKNNALTVRATPQDFARKKHRLLQAMLAVNDMFYTASGTVATLFVEDVAAWLHDADIRATPDVRFTGVSGYDHTFDFVIPASRVAPERIIQTINRPSRERIEAVAFAWIDTHKARSARTESRGYALLNDSQGRPPRGTFGALEQYGIRPVLWSHRDEVRDELAA